MTIVAIGGGGLARHDGRRPLLRHVLDLTGKDRPNVCYVGTAQGDDARYTTMFYDVAREVGFAASHLDLFPMPNVPDVRAHLLAQDAIYVGGGSVANLLAVWRTHGLDGYLAEARDAGVVLAGTSAGSICWFEGGTTDSFGDDPLRPVTNGLAFVPASNTPHYDSEERRRPLYQRLVREGVLSPGWAADDGVGLVFDGTELTEAVAYGTGAAWRVERDGETRVEPRRL